MKKIVLFILFSILFLLPKNVFASDEIIINNIDLFPKDNIQKMIESAEIKLNTSPAHDRYIIYYEISRSRYEIFFIPKDIACLVTSNGTGFHLYADSSSLFYGNYLPDFSLNNSWPIKSPMRIYFMSNSNDFYGTYIYSNFDIFSNSSINLTFNYKDKLFSLSSTSKLPSLYDLSLLTFDKDLDKKNIVINLYTIIFDKTSFFINTMSENYLFLFIFTIPLLISIFYLTKKIIKR